jgi:hypothetical protein
VKLGEIAKVIRSKNAGPFELTLDIMFDGPETYGKALDSGLINSKTISKLYHVPESKILGIIPFPPAYAIKITMVRPLGSGDVGDTDIYGAQQHAPLLDLEVSL